MHIETKSKLWPPKKVGWVSIITAGLLFTLGYSSGAGSSAQAAMIMLLPSAQSTVPASKSELAPDSNRKIVVVSEGSSSAKFWGGNHTGIYAKSRPDIEFYGLAKGGSTLVSLARRQQAVLDLKPDVVSIYIGSNDLGKYPDAQTFADKLFHYTDKLRSSGSKVVIATLLARQTKNSEFNRNHNRLRKEVAILVRNAVGSRIDGVADFAADPVMGTDQAPFDRTLFSDRLHPTDSTHGVGEGGQAKLARIYKVAMDKVID